MAARPEIKNDGPDDAARRFLGMRPYNQPSNPCVGDGYFYIAEREKHGQAFVEAVIRLKKQQGGNDR